MYLRGGFPGDVTDTAEIPGAIATLVQGGGGGGGAGGITDASVVNTPEQQRLIDEGIGVQLSPGQPISHPAEGMPRTQAELDAYNRIPVSTDYVDPYTDLGFEEPRPTYADQYLDDLYTTGELPVDTSGEVGTMTPTYVGGERTLADAGAGIDDMYATDYPGEPQTVTGTDQFRPRVSQLGPGDLEVTGEPLTGTDQFSPRVSRLGRGETLDPMDLYSGAADEGYPEAPTFEDEYMGMAPGDVQGYAPQETLNIFQKVGQTIEGAVNDLRTAGHNVVQRGTDFIVDIGGKTIDIGQSVKAGTLSVLGQLVDVPFLGPVSTLVGEGMPEWSEEDIAAQKYAKTTEQFDPSGSLGKDEFGLNTRTTDGKTYVDRVQERQEELKDIIADQKANETFKEGSWHDRQFKHNENVLAEQGITPTVEEDILSDFPAGDAQVATDIYKQPEEVLEAKQEQQEYIQEIQQQETVQSGSREADRQQRDTGVAKVETDHGTRYESSSGDTYASASEAAEKGDGGGGGSSKIVCTMMNDSYGFGSFRNKIWLKQSKGLTPYHQIGYHKIFLPLVKFAKRKGFINNAVKKTLEHIAIHRTIDIRQETRDKRHLLGRLYRKILEPICYWAGKNR